MQYRVEHNKVNCILPVFTKKIKREIDETNEQLSNAEVPLDDRVDAMYGFLKGIIGEESLSKALGNDDLDEIDLNDVSILYLKVTKEYDRPVTEFNRPVLDAETKKMLKEVADAAKSMSLVNARKK